MIWTTILKEAKLENSLSVSLLDDLILPFTSVQESLSHILSNKLACSYLGDRMLLGIIHSAYQENSSLTQSLEGDLQAILDRDFACKNYLNPLLFFNGFHGLQLYRIAHHYHCSGDTLTASLLHERMVTVCSMDIHPAANIGQSVVIDHGLGIVIGETAVIGDDVFLYHNVTLGSTGIGGEKRHPTIENGVLIGSGATILGDITIHQGAAIAAGSMVTKSVPSGELVGGNPARVLGRAKAFQRK